MSVLQTKKTEGKALVRKLQNSQIDSDQYQEEFARQVERVSESNQAMLAEYVVHRRAILNIFKAALNRKDDGKFNRESFLHELIYPMRATSDEVAYQAHNLWLVDERLTFSGFIASDKPFGGEAHEQRPDIMCLDHAVFVSSEETDGLPYDTVTIFELKRPGRDDYNESDNPITQLLNYAGRIRSNQERDANGRSIRVNENTRMYLYAVCDITQSLQRILDARGYGYTADGEGRTSFNPIYNAYIGEIPEKFTYEGKEYTPQSFAESLGLNMDDYVSLTSFTHHPFYTQFAIEVQDNWRWGLNYNLPLDEFMEVMDYAVRNGYTFAWGADVSEPSFRKHEVVLMPKESTAKDNSGSDQAKWQGDTDKDDMVKNSQNEKEITQEMRQEAYDNWETTDDHGMLIYGLVKDQNGKEYFMMKNSWGDYNKYHGKCYISKAYVAYKTLNILIHKDALPKAIAKKLKLK